MELSLQHETHLAVCDLETSSGTLQIKMHSDIFVCEEYETSLFSSPLTRTLLFYLTQAGSRGLCDRQLAFLVYQESNLEQRSHRYQQAAKHRIIKLISRARSWLNKEYQGVLPERCRWLPYNPHHKRWYLVGSMPQLEWEKIMINQ